MGVVVGDIVKIVPELEALQPDLKSSLPLEDLDAARFRLFDSIQSFFNNICQNLQYF